MQEIISVLGDAIPLATAVVGLLVALDQLSLGVRLRRRADWAYKLSQKEWWNRRKILEDIYHKANGKVIAATLIPLTRMFLPTLVIAFFFFALTILLMQNEDPIKYTLLVSLGSLPLFNYVLQFLLERARITSQYEADQPVEVRDTSFAHSLLSGGKLEWLLCVMLSAGLTGLIWGFAYQGFEPEDFPLTRLGFLVFSPTILIFSYMLFKQLENVHEAGAKKANN